MLIQQCYDPIRDSRSKTVTLQMPHDQLLRGCEANLKHGFIMSKGSGGWGSDLYTFEDHGSGAYSDFHVTDFGQI